MAEFDLTSRIPGLEDPQALAATAALNRAAAPDAPTPAVPPPAQVPFQALQTPASALGGPYTGNPVQDAVTAVQAGETPPPGQTKQQQMALLAMQRPQGAALGAGTQQVKTGQQNTTSTSGVVVTPEYRKATERADLVRAEQAATVEENGAKLAQQAQDAARLTAERAAELDKSAKAQRELQLKQEQEIKTLTEQRVKDQAEYQKAAANLDPERLLNTGGSRVLAAISLGLGAFAATLGGTPNFAMQQIQSALDRDYKGQQDRVGALKDKSTLSGQIIQDVRQRFADVNARELAYQSSMQQVLATKVEAMGQVQGGERAQQQKQELAAALRSDSAEKDVQSKALELQHKQSSSTTSYATVDGAAAKAKGYMDYLKQLEQEAQTAKARQGAFGSAPSEQQRTSAEKVKNDVAAGIKFFKQADQLRKDNNDSNMLGRVGDNERAALIKNMAGNMAYALYGQSTTTAQEEAIAKQIEGSWHTITSSGHNEALGQSELDLARAMNAKLTLLHPDLRTDVLRSLHQGGVNPAVIRAIETGKAPVGGRDSTRSLGGTER